MKTSEEWDRKTDLKAGKHPCYESASLLFPDQVQTMVTTKIPESAETNKTVYRHKTSAGHGSGSSTRTALQDRERATGRTELQVEDRAEPPSRRLPRTRPELAGCRVHPGVWLRPGLQAAPLTSSQVLFPGSHSEKLTAPEREKERAGLAT